MNYWQQQKKIALYSDTRNSPLLFHAFLFRYMSEHRRRIVPLHTSGQLDATLPIGSLHSEEETTEEFATRHLPSDNGTLILSDVSTDIEDPFLERELIHSDGTIERGYRQNKMLTRYPAVTHRESEQYFSFDLTQSDDEFVQLEENIIANAEGISRGTSGEEGTGQVRGRGSQFTRGVITWNNPTITGEEFKQFLEGNARVKLAIFQEEVGDSGTRHFQGYIETTTRLRTNGWQNMLHPYRMSVMMAKGTKTQNHTYCTKDGRIGGPWYVKSSANDYGKTKQGKRNDLDRFAELVVEHGGITEEVRGEMPGHVVRFGNHGKQYMADINREKAEKEELKYWLEQCRLEDEGLEITGQLPRELVLYFGPTAVGKTTKAKMDCVRKYTEMPFLKQGGTKWWDGYNAQMGVLVDEWRKDMACMEEFNNITNAGPSSIEIKGGTNILVCKSIWFTTNRHPMDIFETVKIDGRYQALARRFTQVKWWKSKDELLVLNNPGVRPQNPSEEWLEGQRKWSHFWNFRDHAVQEGDNFNSDTFNYFEW